MTHVVSLHAPLIIGYDSDHNVELTSCIGMHHVRQKCAIHNANVILLNCWPLLSSTVFGVATDISSADIWHVQFLGGIL